MSNICTVCMRGGSKGVPGKNTRLIGGKPLMAYTIEQAKESGLFDHVVVSTDSLEIAETARCFGAESWFMRPAELSTDEAPKIPVIRHALLEAEQHYGQKFDVLVDLDATSPLRAVGDITGAYRQFIEQGADILITACPARKNPYFNMVERVDNQIRKVKELVPPPVRRQDAPAVYDMNASIYIWRREILLSLDTLFTEKTSLFVMPEERSVDIDTVMDWAFVEFIIQRQAGENE